MKSVIKAIVIVFAATSMNAFATNVIESLSIETIKQTMTKDQIELVLNKWKNERLANIEIEIEIELETSLSTSQVPAGARGGILRAQIEYEYEKLAKSLGL